MLHRIASPLPAGFNASGRGRPHAHITRLLWNIIYILVSFELGIVLLFLPWWRFWENNYLLYLYPQIRPLVANSYFKGFVLGLGIVNILLGIHEIVDLRKTWKKGYLPR